MSLPTLTTSGQSLHALLQALDYRLGYQKKNKKNIPVSVSRAQRGGAPPSDPPLKFRRPLCASINREQKGELLQHMETEMEGGNEKRRRYFQKMGQPQELKNESNVEVGKTAVPLGAT